MFSVFLRFSFGNDSLGFRNHDIVHLPNLLDGHIVETDLEELIQFILYVGAVCLGLSSCSDMIEPVSIETEEHICSLDDFSIRFVLGVEPLLHQSGKLMIHIQLYNKVKTNKGGSGTKREPPKQISMCSYVNLGKSYA